MENIKHTHGGSRPGAGRKKGEETKTVSFRIKPAEEKPLKIIVKKALYDLRNPSA